MTENIFTYLVKMPDSVHEAVTPCLDGYTVYLNDKLTPEQRKKAYLHALKHIKGNDFEKADVQSIEASRHK